tara:strand:- start:1225 stop:1431 length:207 start_codon:yes stop_codon:yes gene_type:complete
MAKQNINIGSTANDGTGDDLRTAGDKINDNFTELYNFDSQGIVNKAKLQQVLNSSDSYGSFKSAILAL